MTSLWKLLAPVCSHLWITTQLLVLKGNSTTSPKQKCQCHRALLQFKRVGVIEFQGHSSTEIEVVNGMLSIYTSQSLEEVVAQKNFNRLSTALTLVTVCFLVNQQIVLSPGENMKNREHLMSQKVKPHKRPMWYVIQTCHVGRWKNWGSARTGLLRVIEKARRSAESCSTTRQPRVLVSGSLQPSFHASFHLYPFHTFSSEAESYFCKSSCFIIPYYIKTSILCSRFTLSLILDLVSVYSCLFINWTHLIVILGSRCNRKTL